MTADSIRLFTFDPSEVTDVCSLFGSMGNRETDRDFLWLSIDESSRTWFVDTTGGRGTIRFLVTDESDQAGNTYAIPERLVQFASSCDGPVEVTKTGESYVATCGDRSAVIDAHTNVDHTPRQYAIENRTYATVSRETFNRTLWSARCVPSGADDTPFPMPPIWMRVGDDTIALHIDWTDAVGGKTTFRMGASVRGPAATEAINHSLVSRVLHHHTTFTDDDGPMSLRIADVLPIGSLPGASRRAVIITTGSLELMTWVVDPLRERWSHVVSSMLFEGDLEPQHVAGTEWLCSVDDIEIRVKLHAGHPDVVRVSAVVATYVDATPELLAELNTLNAAVTGARLWHEGSSVFAATDVRCTELEYLLPAINAVAESTSKYAPLLGILGGSTTH